jgi:lipoprotein-releasing system ATP-binding protein
MSERAAGVPVARPGGRPEASAIAAPLPLEARDVHKVYTGVGAQELHILAGVDLRVQPGEAVAIIGASGAGKSTFLHLLGALDRPTRGEVLVGGVPVSGLADVELAAVRNRHVGFVFQFHHLLREFTALENVMMPRLIGGERPAQARERAEGLLAAVGLAKRAGHKPYELSGGEQQRVAVARALANEPLVLLADEPSGNLDHHTSEQLHDVLFQVRDERNLSMVLVTHNLELARRADRILRLEDGLLGPAGVEA